MELVFDSTSQRPTVEQEQESRKVVTGDEMAFRRELPDDLTADILRRLPPRSLAVSRCDCRGWRDLVDARRLLRADLLPLSVGGIFMHYCALYSPEFLARPPHDGTTTLRLRRPGLRPRWLP
jgi:hypothetical protein